jgi:acetoacetate decarboxylase
MGFIKSKEEIKEIEAILSRGRCTIEAISIEFETTFEFLREVLPPCFELPEKPIGIASVSRWQSELCGEYDCGIISLKCRYDGMDGTTMLILVTTGDMAVTIGREMWGECKKPGVSMVYMDGNDGYGFTQRHGQRLIEIDAEFGPNQGPEKENAYDFEIKAFPHTSGIGLHSAPVLNVMYNDANYSVIREGKGSLRFNGTQFDPVHTIPVVSVGKATYVEGESNWTSPRADVLSNADDYLPFIYGQKYDDFRLMKHPARFRRNEK